jgi:hypothetical protein
MGYATDEPAGNPRSSATAAPGRGFRAHQKARVLTKERASSHFATSVESGGNGVVSSVYSRGGEECRFPIRRSALFLVTAVLLLGALAASRFLGKGNAPGTPDTSGTETVVLSVLVALGAGLGPAWQAARVEPAEALRYE